MPTRHASIASLAAALAVVLAAGCGSGSGGGDARDGGPGGGDGGGDVDGGPAAGDCDEAEVLAHVALKPGTDSAFDFQNLSGGYLDRPRAVLVAPIEAAGACAFMGMREQPCEPACDPSSEQCDAAGVCRPFATGVSAGTARVRGTTPEFAVEPAANFPGVGYGGGEHTDLYRAADRIEIAFDGDGEVAPLTMVNLGVPRLEVPVTALTATEHEDLTIAWQPVVSPAGAEVVVRLNENHHGGIDFVECVAPAADGELTVPAAILDRVIAASGAFGIEQAWATLRRRTATPTGDGCARFDAMFEVALSVETVRAE